jgi:Uma2 family endonuclease
MADLELADVQRMTPDEFERYALLPKNEDHLLELICGEVVEMPSNPFSSYVGSIILAALMAFVRPRKLGYVTGEAGGYRVGAERYAPDAAFISFARQPELAHSGYNPNPPELAVEVVYPATVQALDEIRKKIVNYLLVGTLLWVVFPEKKIIEVYAPNTPVRVLGIHDALDGGEVLPGFSLPLKDIFT